ncbi:MAG: acyl-ACP--UDP-N-acetylglucosamine O-acyltransferase [Marinilabiliaceae bacterium]|jgi:UDP-N-acetylglucosamine acyltransferase|nr:acyl-ACP--UDP-N-acetylglucosamine O-acyltransferase [Marinilabiliaceae bacterium]
MISQKAYIHPDAKLGKDVIVEPFAYIAGDVVIGDGSWIGPNSVIMDGARLGKACKTFPGAVISAIPQDLKFDGEKTTTEIGDNTVMREGVTVNRGTVALGKTIVGSNCLLMANSHVAHDCVVGDYCILVNNVGLAGEVVLGDWVIMGGGSAVHQFVHIGAHAMISGGTMLRKDVPPYVIINHNPVGYMGINNVGLRRRGFSKSQIDLIHDIYRIIYQSGKNTSQALEFINESVEDCPEKTLVLEFITGSKRGIIKSAAR